MKVKCSALRTAALLGATLLGLFVALSLAMPAVAFAHGNPPPFPEPDCRIYEKQDDGDFDNAIVNVNLFNTGSPGNPDSITVTAKNGWTIARVDLEVEDNNQSGWDETYFPNSGSFTINPPGEDIEEFKVKLTKDCYEACDETTDWVLVDTSEWVFNPDTGLMGQTPTYEKYDVRDQSVCDTKQEVETRDPDQRFFSEETCEGWEVFQTGEGIDGNELVDAGVWENPLVDESFTATGDGYEIFIEEPQDCFEIGDHVRFEADW